MPSFPSRSEKVGLDIDQSPLKLKPCFPPPLNLTKEEISIDAVFIANSRDRSSPRLICDLCQKAGPPVQIDCVDILKGLEHEDLTDFSLDDDDFSDSF